MAKLKYYSDIGNEVVELKNIHQIDNAKFARQFPGIQGLRADGYTKLAGYPVDGTGGVLPVTRRIEFKTFPSRHECNSKCLTGKSTGTCECQCGGKNHGRGMFTQLLAAA